VGLRGDRDDVAPVELVEFWAAGCAPSENCHRAVSALSHQVEGDVVVKSFDVWETPERTAEFEVLSLPTIILVVGGVERCRWIGRPATAAELAQRLAEQLDPVPASIRLAAAATPDHRRARRSLSSAFHRRPHHAH
jgi:thioredoxin 1